MNLSRDAECSECILFTYWPVSQLIIQVKKIAKHIHYMIDKVKKKVTKI